MIIRLDSADDARVKDYGKLTDTQLRRSVEAAQGLYIAESSKVLRRALAAGHRPRSFFMAEKWLDSLADVFAAHPETPVYCGSDAVLEEITGFHLHRGALAAMDRPEPVDFRSLLAGARRLAVLEDIVDHTNVKSFNVSAEAVPVERPQRRSRIAILDSLVDHTNVGAVFRSAAAIGVDAVLVTPQCADPLYRRSVRVSMGTVFQVPWTRIENWPASVQDLKDAGYIVAGMTLGEGAITLDELVAEDHQDLALVFGSEGPGLAPRTEQLLDRRVTIPMMGGVDSLNVAASSAVAFYATRSTD